MPLEDGWTDGDSVLEGDGSTEDGDGAVGVAAVVAAVAAAAVAVLRSIPLCVGTYVSVVCNA